MKQIIDQPNVRTKDALRLVALYTIRYSREVERSLDQICGSVKGSLTTPMGSNPAFIFSLSFIK